MIKLNGIEIKPTMFPDKTSQVWQLDNIKPKDNFVLWEFESERELFHLLQLSELLPKRGDTLYMPYLPYARQDKSIGNEETFALHSFCKVINLMDFKLVMAYDTHSELPTKLINNFVNIFPEKCIKDSIRKSECDTICLPDKGAVVKYGQKLPKYIYADKVRDQLSGKILSLDIHGSCRDKNVLVIDDLCDGGGTFVWLTNELKKAGAKNVDLYISHGLFTKGKDVLYEAGIRNIYTANYMDY